MGSDQQISIAEAEPCRHLLTVRDFLTLDEAGAFDEIGRVELIEGEIFRMAPLHRPHARITMVLSGLIDAAVEALDAGIEALSEPSAELDPHSLPQADIVVADAADEDFVTPRTVRLLVEISASSLRHDLGPKLRLYARTGVSEYWVADVEGRRIIRFHAPAGEAYAERAAFAFGDVIPSATIPGLTVDTARLA